MMLMVSTFMLSEFLFCFCFVFVRISAPTSHSDELPSLFAESLAFRVHYSV